MILDWNSWLAWLLITVRITSLMVVAPFFAVRNFSMLARIGLGAVTALLFLPVIPVPDLQSGLGLYLVWLGGEALTGLVLGLGASFILLAVRIAGELIDLQIGFGAARLLDPVHGSQVTLLGQLYELVAVLLFLLMDGHHVILAVLSHSFALLPLGGSIWGGDAPFVIAMLRIFKEMFFLSFQLMVPIVAVLVITDIALGLVARTVPQLNVFLLGFPLKIILGLLSIVVLLPIIFPIIQELVITTEQDLLIILRSLGGAR